MTVPVDRGFGPMPPKKRKAKAHEIAIEAQVREAGSLVYFKLQSTTGQKITIQQILDGISDYLIVDPDGEWRTDAAPGDFPISQDN